MNRNIATEADWLRATNPTVLWYSRFARDRRKRILAACACARRVLPVLGDDPRAVALIDAVERYADADGDPADADARWAVVLAARRPLRGWRKRPAPRDTPRRLYHALAAVEAASRCEGAGPGGVFNDAQWAWRGRTLTPGVTERQAQTAIVRDVFGNPFRPVPFSPEWRTDTALALAHQMDDSRDFSAMPILADALQEAGCNSEDVLGHCRDTNSTHVRGCWVVDLLLDRG